MKIKETVERECCQQQDLKKYRGQQSPDAVYLGLKFCQFCGQLWYETSQGDAAGGQEAVLRKISV
jgi:hypothetical protein